MRLFCSICFLTVYLFVQAQFTVGVRDSRFIYGTYTYKNHYVVSLEESIFSEKFGYQYLRGYLGYKNEVKDFNYSGRVYFGSTYNRSYYSTGISLDLRYTLKNRILFDGDINPHYDSAEGYYTCWYAGMGVRLSKNIDLLAGYGNIPEYRLPEDRVKIGFDFHVNNLRVCPKLTFTPKTDASAKSIRPLVDFEYRFNP